MSVYFTFTMSGLEDLKIFSGLKNGESQFASTKPFMKLNKPQLPSLIPTTPQFIPCLCLHQSPSLYIHTNNQHTNIYVVPYS